MIISTAVQLFISRRRIRCQIVSSFHQKSLVLECFEFLIFITLRYDADLKMAHCSICLDVAKSPACCIPCGHVFCNICIQRWRARSHGIGIPVQLAEIAAAECPQCRCYIEAVQPIRFDASELPDVDDGLYYDPWDESDVGNIYKSLNNIWKRSVLRHHLVRLQERALSHDRVKSGWYKFKDGCRMTKRLTHEFMAVEGGAEDKINWLMVRGKQGIMNLQTRIVSHPYTESIKTRWNALSEDWKFVYIMAILVSVILLVLDVQNKDGLAQSVILPVFTTVFCILREIGACIGYTLFRPVFGSMLCTMEVATTIAEISMNLILTLLNITLSLIALPVTVVIGLIQFITVAVNTLLRTFLPLFLLAYFLSPTVQQHCRNLLTRLQQNHG